VQEAGNMVVDLRENYSLFCSVLTYPAIPKGQLLLQLTPTSSHTPEDVDYTVTALLNVRANLEAGQYKAEQENDIESESV
jgi:glycine C-acetyltransferase